MARGGAIAVNIITTFDAGDIQKAQRELAKLAKSIEQPGDGLKALGVQFQSAGKSISSVGIGLTKSVGAVSAAFIAFGISSVKAASEAEAGQNRLRSILEATGLASEEQIVALNKQAKALENLGVVSASNVTIAQSQLATFDLQAETIERLTPAILDYVTAEKGATASASDFKQMTNGLAQALQGNFASLTRTGFVLDKTTKELIKNGTEAERSAALVQVLNSTYKGFNETLRGTTEGRLQVLRNSFDDLRERIGSALLPIMETFTTFLSQKLVPALEKVVIKFENLTESQRLAAVGIVGFGAVIGPVLVLVGQFVAAIGSIIRALGAMTAAAAAARISLIRLFLVSTLVVGLIAGIKALADRFEPVRIAVGYVGAAFQTVFTAAELIVTRVAYALAVARAALERLAGGVSDKTANDLEDLRRRAAILSGTIDQAFANVRNKSILATEALRDQTTATRNSLPVTKSAADLAEELSRKTSLSEEAQKKAAAAAKKLAEKLKEQGKAMREIATDFANFVKEVSRPEASLEGFLADANKGLDTFRATAANTSIRTDTLIKKLEALGAEIRESLNGALDLAKAKLKAAQEQYDSFASEVSKSIRGIVNFGSAMQTAQTRSKEATDRLTESIAQQTEKVTQAQNALQTYAGSISGAISSTLNFGKAFETATEKGTSFLDELKKQVSGAQTFAIQIKELVARGLSQEALQEVVGAGETGTAIARELLSGGADAIKRANDLVVSLREAADEAGLFSASKFYGAGVSSAQEILNGLVKTVAENTSFLQALNDQAENATKFADKVKKLSALGLSPAALTEVLAAGFESGSLIADEIIKGGETIVTQINSLVQSVQDVADAVGKDAADAYYKVGVDLAKQMVQGILDQINAAAKAIADALAAAAAGRQLPVTIPGGSGPTSPTSPTSPIRDLVSGTAKQIGIPLEQLKSELAAQVAQNQKIVDRLAAGGLGTGAVSTLKRNLEIGRISAESLRTDIRSFGPTAQTPGSTINLTVNAGLGTSGQDVGKEIVEEILRFQRRSGEFLLEAQ